MAYLELKYHSDALKMGVSVNVVLPENAKTAIGISGNASSKFKTLYLLHGLSDDHTIWMRRTSIERYASERGIAVVMPSVGRSWYTDTATGANYLTFVRDELPRVCQSYFRGMSSEREYNFVAGLSMGGYGAMKVALTAPDRFFGAASLSGALDIAAFGENSDASSEWQGIFGFSFKSPSELRGSCHDLFQLVNELKNKGEALPKIYMWCGTEDFLLQHNRDFDRELTRLSVPHTYEETEGIHTWKYWDMHISRALDILLEV